MGDRSLMIASMVGVVGLSATFMLKSRRSVWQWAVSTGLLGSDERSELLQREELADAHALVKRYDMDELVWNHLSVRLKSQHEDGYLITPGRHMFNDILAADLSKTSTSTSAGGSENVTGDIIHDAIYQARPDVHAIVHLHTPAAVAVSCLECGFMPLAQESAFFHERIAYHKWEGISDDKDEQTRLGEAVTTVSGSNGNQINTLIMNNHGFCVMGGTIGEAWVLAYYFEKSCRTQLSCMQSRQKIIVPSNAVMAHAASQAWSPGLGPPGEHEWNALRRSLHS